MFNTDEFILLDSLKDQVRFVLKNDLMNKLSDKIVKIKMDV